MEKECTYGTGCFQEKTGSMPQYYHGMCEDYDCKYYTASPQAEPATASCLSELLDNARPDGWYQIESIDDLSIGDMYFYSYADDKSVVVLAEFVGDGFSSEYETIEFDDDFDFSSIWFMDFEWPKPPMK
jgi:hypothetical protein